MMSPLTQAQDVSHPRVLYFTKSAGYEHSVVKRDGDELSHSEKILQAAFAKEGIDVVCSKDGSDINADYLKEFETVIFYTSGNLLEEGTDGHPAISEEGLQALFDWITAGGGFIGIHAASDSMREEQPSPYTKMMGGAFQGHGKQEAAIVRVVDPEFPAVDNLPLSFEFVEEWYIHNQVDAAGTMHVLAVLETGKMSQEMYNQSETLPIIWCSSYGKGRVLYNGIGHREDVWEMPVYQGSLIRAFEWTSGKIEGDPVPNGKEFLK